MKIFIVLTFLYSATAQFLFAFNYITGNYGGYRFEYHESHKLLLVKNSLNCYLILTDNALEAAIQNGGETTKIKAEVAAQIKAGIGLSPATNADIKYDFHDYLAATQCRTQAIHKLDYKLAPPSTSPILSTVTTTVTMAQTTVTEATTQAQTTVTEATTQAQTTVTEATTQAHTTVTEATTQAQTTVTDAKAQATSPEAVTQAQTTVTDAKAQTTATDSVSEAQTIATEAVTQAQTTVTDVKALTPPADAVTQAQTTQTMVTIARE